MEVFLHISELPQTHILTLLLNKVKLVVELTEGIHVFLVDFALVKEEKKKILRRGL